MKPAAWSCRATPCICLVRLRRHYAEPTYSCGVVDPSAWPMAVHAYPNRLFRNAFGLLKKRSGMSTVEINIEGDITPEAAEAARRRLESLQRYTDLPFMGGRLTLRHVQQGRTRLPYVADARVTFDGRHMAAHTAGRTPEEAVEQA